MDGKLFLAPIGDYPQKIVDLGTGVGLWAQDSLFLHTSTLRYRRLTIFYQWPRTSPAHASLEPTYHLFNHTGLLPTWSFGSRILKTKTAHGQESMPMRI